MPPRLRSALKSIVHRRKLETDLEREMRFHLEMEMNANIGKGMSPAQAREASLRSFGSVEQVKEAVRGSWGARFFDTMMQDVRFAIRNMRKNPGFSAVVLLTLALGIGANTAMFSVINGVLLRALPYGGGDRLVVLHQPAAGIKTGDVGFSPKEIADYREQSRTLDAVVEYHSMSFNLFGRGEAQRVQTGVVSANFFDILGVRPLHGRTFVAADDAPGAPAVLVLSYPYFKSAFGGDPAIVGQTFEMNDKVHTVVGVLPAVPQYPDENDIYMPSSACPFRSAQATIDNRQARMLAAFGRLRPGATIEQAQSDLALIAGHFAAAYPSDYPAVDGITAKVEKLREELVHPARQTLLILFATTGFVLLLVCANVANLMLARTAGRERELSLRMALGAGRGRLIRQLLTESAVLSLAGGALGLAFAQLMRDMLVTFVLRFTPRASEIDIDGRVLLFALGSSLVTGLLFGLIPAMTSRHSLATSLNSGRAGTGARLALGTRHALIVSQVAISFVLLTGAGLMLRSFVELERVDPGFNPENVLAVNLSLNWSKYTDEAKRIAFYRPLIESIAARPGVIAASMGTTIPLNESAPWTAALMIEGKPQAPNQPRPQVSIQFISPDYFRAIGTPLLRGRVLDERDKAEAPTAVVINEAMARRFFGDEDPIGHRVALAQQHMPAGGEKWGTIVGVVGNVKEFGLDKETSEELFLSLLQEAHNGGTLFVRTQGDPWALVAPIRERVRQLDPKQPVGRVRTLEQVRANDLASPRLTTALIGLFALLALVITAAGIVGVVSYSVSQRTQEIGIRMALGADRDRVVQMVLRQGLAPVVIGMAAGVIGALALTKLMAGLLFGVGPTDPTTFAAVLLGLFLVAATACWHPARRAAGIEPMLALRSD